MGARATLQTNFRSRPEILRVLNATFEPLLGTHFRPLVPGRDGTRRRDDPRVELLVADKGADWTSTASARRGGWPRRARSPPGSASCSPTAPPRAMSCC